MSQCGVYSTYVQGCRCEPCKRANAAYQRKYRSSQEKRALAVRVSRRRNYAAMLALKYLRTHDKRTYYRLMDEAQQWIDNSPRK